MVTVTRVSLALATACLAYQSLGLARDFRPLRVGMVAATGVAVLVNVVSLWQQQAVERRKRLGEVEYLD